MVRAPTNDPAAPPRPRIPFEAKAKVPANVRQMYLEKLIDANNQACTTYEESYQKSLDEERDACLRAKDKKVYLSLMANLLLKIKKQSGVIKPAATTTQTMSHADILCGPKAKKMSFSIEKNRFRTHVPKDNFTGELLQRCGGQVRGSIRASVALAAASRLELRGHLLQFRVSSLGQCTLAENRSWVLCHSSTMTKFMYYAFSSMLHCRDRGDISACIIITEEEFYEHLKANYLMKPEELDSMGYPRPHTLPGRALFRNEKALSAPPDPRLSNERTCSRCNKLYLVDEKGLYLEEEPCVHHWGKNWQRKGTSSSSIVKHFDCAS